MELIHNTKYKIEFFEFFRKFTKIGTAPASNPNRDPQEYTLNQLPLLRSSTTTNYLHYHMHRTTGLLLYIEHGVDGSELAAGTRRVRRKASPYLFLLDAEVAGPVHHLALHRQPRHG